eukprot:scaffold2349_cov140-Skeletonema_menzelii.AAC.15
MNAQISGTRRQRKLRSLHVPNTGTGLVPILLLAAVLVWEDDMLYKCDRQRLQELKRSREEVQKQKQAEEIKRLKGAIQALISSSH